MTPGSSTTNVDYHPGIDSDDLQLILEKTPSEVWENLRKKRIFITGGTGFIGCWLLEALLWANQQLTLELSLNLLTRNPQAFITKAKHLALHPTVKLIQGDVSELSGINETFDIVIHAATDVAVADVDTLVLFDSIVQGTKETLALAQRCNAQRYLLTSSGAVYGKQPEWLTHIPENYSGAPDTSETHNAYGHGKRISEWLALNAAKSNGIEVKITRCFALIGPYLPLNAHFAAGNFIRDGLANQPIAIKGDGTSCRSYLYAADMVIWLLTILINGSSNQPYNLGSADSISIKSLAEIISHSFYGEQRISITQQPASNTKSQQYVPDISKSMSELQLQQYTDLYSAITKTIAWEKRRRRIDSNHINGVIP